MAVQDAEVAFAARYHDHVGLGRENLALGHDQPEGRPWPTAQAASAASFLALVTASSIVPTM